MGILANLTDIMSKNAVAAAFSAMVVATPAAASDNRDIVESHDILLLDVSSSMDTADIQASFQGVAQHYLSDEAMMNYRAGICTANTVIYFASQPVRQNTHVLCNEEDVHEFLAVNINEERLGGIRALAGSQTFVEPALKEAAVVLAGEKEILKIEAMRHRVVIAGDENGGSIDILRPHSMLLSARFGATVNAVAIGDAGVKAFFEAAVVTPRGVKYVADFDGRKIERPLAPGIASIALNSQQAATAFQTILSLNTF